MRAAGFERFAVDGAHVYVSICRACLQFVAAAPDPALRAIAEDLHACLRAPRTRGAMVSGITLASKIDRRLARNLRGAGRR